jgi:hypothetical protein
MERLQYDRKGQTEDDCAREGEIDNKYRAEDEEQNNDGQQIISKLILCHNRLIAGTFYESIGWCVVCGLEVTT